MPQALIWLRITHYELRIFCRSLFGELFFYLLTDGFSFYVSFCFSISLLFDKETLAKKTKNFSFRGKETFIKEKPIHQPSNRSTLYIRSGFSCNLYSSGFKRALAKLITDNKQSKKNLLLASFFLQLSRTILGLSTCTEYATE